MFLVQCWMFNSLSISSGMQDKTTDHKFKPKWLTEYTVSLILGLLFILIFWWFTSTFNLP